VPVRPFAVLLIALAAALPAGAQVYKWTGPDGRTHYGDRPPENAPLKELKIGVQSFGGPARVDNWAEVIRRPPPPSTAAPGAAAITFYSTAWCPHCKRARSYFAQKGLEVREVDIEASEDGMREFREFGGQGVPLILVGEQRMRGFDAAAMDRLLAPQGRARP
jgi:glutaredoxin